MSQNSLYVIYSTTVRIGPRLAYAYASLLLENTSSLSQSLHGLRQWSSLPHIPELLLWQLVACVGSSEFNISACKTWRLSPRELLNSSRQHSTRNTGQHLVLDRHVLEADCQTGQVTCCNGPESVPAIVFLSQVGDHTLGGSGHSGKSRHSQWQADLEGGSLPQVQPGVSADGGVEGELKHLDGLCFCVNRLPFRVCTGINKVDEGSRPLVRGVWIHLFLYFCHGG